MLWIILIAVILILFLKKQSTPESILQKTEDAIKTGTAQTNTEILSIGTAVNKSVPIVTSGVKETVLDIPKPYATNVVSTIKETKSPFLMPENKDITYYQTVRGWNPEDVGKKWIYIATNTVFTLAYEKYSNSYYGKEDFLAYNKWDCKPFISIE